MEMIIKMKKKHVLFVVMSHAVVILVKNNLVFKFCKLYFEILLFFLDFVLDIFV